MNSQPTSAGELNQIHTVEDELSPSYVTWVSDLILRFLHQFGSVEFPDDCPVCGKWGECEPSCPNHTRLLVHFLRELLFKVQLATSTRLEWEEFHGLWPLLDRSDRPIHEVLPRWWVHRLLRGVLGFISGRGSCLHPHTCPKCGASHKCHRHCGNGLRQRTLVLSEAYSEMHRQIQVWKQLTGHELEDWSLDIDWDTGRIWPEENEP